MDTTDVKRRGLMAALALLPLGAQAHGDAHKPAGPAKREQTDWGIAGDARAVRRTVDVRMTDTMRFTPDRIAVREGETLRLRVHNAGRLMHEFVIGTPATLDEHAKLMEKFPGMEHDEPYMAHVPPGRSGEIVWTFNRAGDFRFACLIAGHYAAGMVGHISVAPRAAR
jgi:uncharacterized cupredoxin-like copper-binding protein